MSELLTQKENLENETESNLVYPKHCPICGVDTSYVYKIEESSTKKCATWYRCQCGVIFQENLPSHKGYNEKYFTDYAAMKEGDTRITHSARTYVNLIEELTYGRMMLDVGFCVPQNMQFFRDRGWLTWGIDVNESLEYGGSLYKGNFLEYDFSLPIKDKEMQKQIGSEKIDRTFDLIWMGHVFEHFNDPIAVLKKAYDLLSFSGVIFIATPDADFINKTGVPGYPHWKADEHYIIWNETSLKRELEKVGFKIAMSRRNYSSRYSSWYDIHCLAQKNYF